MSSGTSSPTFTDSLKDAPFSLYTFTPQDNHGLKCSLEPCTIASELEVLPLPSSFSQLQVRNDDLLYSQPTKLRRISNVVTDEQRNSEPNPEDILFNEIDYSSRICATLDVDIRNRLISCHRELSMGLSKSNLLLDHGSTDFRSGQAKVLLWQLQQVMVKPWPQDLIQTLLRTCEEILIMNECIKSSKEQGDA